MPFHGGSGVASGSRKRSNGPEMGIGLKVAALKMIYSRNFCLSEPDASNVCPGW